MENLFKPGKWLVLFCGVFVLLWGVLQYVSNARLKEEAQMVARDIFTWAWPRDNWRSRAEITDAAVVKKSENDAIVLVKGRQHLGYMPSGAVDAAADAGKKGESATANVASNDSGETVDCAAKLTFYRMSVKNKDYWMLGKVEFE